MNKKNITIGIFIGAIVLTLPWLNYDFRKRVCEISEGNICFNVLPLPEKYLKEWKKRNPGKDM